MKQGKIVKVLAVVLSSVLAMGMMGGCSTSSSKNSSKASSKEQTNDNTASSSNLASNTATLDKNDPNATAASNGIILPKLKNDTLKLDVSIAEFQKSPKDTMIQKEWQKRMEKYLGCKLDISWSSAPQADYAANELVVLQSGQVPDAASVTKGPQINEYGEDGTLLDLSKYEKYMRYYQDYIKSTNGKEDYAKNKDGSMYYFMSADYNPDNIEGAQSFTSFAYRFDILKKFGWTPPTTLDEFDELCKNIQGKIDSKEIDTKYVMQNSNNAYALYRGFVGIFHTWDCIYNNGEEWVYGPIEDNFRDMLKYINNLYEKGYIDPEFATADGNKGLEKATTDNSAICPTLWSGDCSTWNNALTDTDMQWGLSYLPANEKYGTAWKWGSRQPGKSLNSTTGIYVSANTKNPEYVTAMIDYQYSDQMVELINWGIEGKTYTKSGDSNTFVDEITKDKDPATKSAEFGLSSSSVCRPGIPFTPLDFRAMLEVAARPEPWWSKDKGYYEGKYWVETAVNGGEDSISPFDRPPVVYLTAIQQSERAALYYGGACDSRAKELALQFISGDKDINSDKDWKAYIKDIKSQTDENFDKILKMMNDNTVKE